jgi:hypothetical protein
MAYRSERRERHGVVQGHTKFLSLWEGETVELSTMMERSWEEERLPFVKIELEVVDRYPS